MRSCAGDEGPRPGGARRRVGSSRSPILNIEVEVPEDVLNINTRVKRHVHGMEQSGLLMKVRGEIPVLETFRLSDNLRDAT